MYNCSKPTQNSSPSTPTPLPSVHHLKPKLSYDMKLISRTKRGKVIQEFAGTPNPRPLESLQWQLFFLPESPAAQSLAVLVTN